MRISMDHSDVKWCEDELAQLEAHANGLNNPPSPDRQPVMNGHSPDRANDPLAYLTPKQTWFECIWLSRESAPTKLMLHCIGRFFDDNAQSSSIAYAQIARECSIHEATAKKIAAHVRDRWLKIQVGKGRYVPGKGAQNLYHGICPDELVGALRQQSGVAQDHPEDERGRVGLPRDAKAGSPTIQPGSPRTTRTSLSLNKEGGGAGATRPAAPHLTSDGFVISAEHGLLVPMQKVTAWRERFPHIPDLEAAMTGLATTILAKGRMHAGWTSPEGWMVKPLSDINAEHADKKRITAARVARADNGGAGRARKTRRAELDEA